MDYKNKLECHCNHKHEEKNTPPCYRIQAGAFRTYNDACNLQLRLFNTGIISDINNNNNCFEVHVGIYSRLDDASRLECQLRRAGYNTHVKSL